ncbi:hypothetical protein ABZX39_34370 [Streptomyces collinus]|uniref:hypothetical protein n=1 Tax=Streptomyces collinus TaxID=42684 RepID=UPI0033AEFB8D
MLGREPWPAPRRPCHGLVLAQPQRSLLPLGHEWRGRKSDRSHRHNWNRYERDGRDWDHHDQYHGDWDHLGWDQYGRNLGDQWRGSVNWRRVNVL